MSKVSKSRLGLAVSVLALCVGGAAPAFAGDDSVSLEKLQAQITALQKQLAEIKAVQVKAAKAPAVAAPIDTSTLRGVVRTKTGADVTLGGFIDMTLLNRDKNQGADTGSSFNTGMPFKNAVQAHQNEVRGSARASRLSLLATAPADEDTRLTAYFETDFGAAASSSTPGQTSSYVPRIRQAFAGYEDTSLGLNVQAGQMWSLVTMNAAGISPFKPLFPMVIDAAFMPGVNYARTPQVRLVKDFDQKRGSFGVSVESPQATTGGICTSSTSPTTNNPSYGSNACAGFNNNIKVATSGFTGNMQGSVTTDVAPDVVAKVAYDPGWGHYELFGVSRFFRSTIANTGHNDYATGLGFGAGAFVPVVPRMIDVQATVMAGKGIGRYGVSQLPDFSLTSTGEIKPLDQYTALLGVVGHPSPLLDAYLYAGLEQTFRHDEGSSTNTYGYGNRSALNTDCNTPGNTTTCMAQTSSVWQITPGLWYRVYDGSFGKMQVGLQHSWTRRNTFADINGANPHSIENITLVSLRFFPF